MLSAAIVLATSASAADGQENEDGPTRNASRELEASLEDTGSDPIRTSNGTNRTVSSSSSGGGGADGLEARIALYAVIFVLSVLGNLLVIVTMTSNKRLRTVTNLLLLNLSFSDLLLSVFCMPFTLVGAVRREFIFGAAMCKMIPYMQGLSVSVGVWTLRYFAICQPLRSRRWQTLSHVYKMIAAVWLVSVVWMLPIALVSQLLPLKNETKFKCREVWPSADSTKVFTIFLDVVLLIVPLAIMTLAYCLITKTLYRGMQQEGEQSASNAISLKTMKGQKSSSPPDGVEADQSSSSSNKCVENGEAACPVRRKWTLQPPEVAKSVDKSGPPPLRRIIRRTNVDKSLAAKRRVIRMLFVVVLEFFVCWTPLYVLNTLSLFAPDLVYGQLGQRTISLVQLLAYVSTCCNPITYCFMHKKFRQSFLAVFGCGRRRRRQHHQRQTMTSGQDGSFYLSRQSTLRTEIICSDKSDDNALARQMRLLTARDHQSTL